ncbi:MAG: hypothetical protein RL277_1893 [Planctomycetota bacterium]
MSLDDKNKSGRMIAAWLDSSSRALAARAMSRLSTQLDSPDEISPYNFSEITFEAEQRLRCLAEAVFVARPELFIMDLEWIRAAMNARGIGPALLTKMLAALRAELMDSLPPERRGEVLGLFDYAHAELLKKPTFEIESAIEKNTPHIAAAREFLLHVLEGNQRAALDLVDRTAAEGVPVPEIHRQVLAPVLQELGRMWLLGESGIAEEHVGSRTVEEALVRLRRHASPRPSNGKTALVASVEGNLHDIGARMVGDQLEFRGWRVIFLGQSVPAPDIAMAAVVYKADVVALSAGTIQHVRPVARAVEHIRTSGSHAKVLVGGGPFAALRDLYEDVGADAGAVDALGALQAAEAITA